MRTQELDYELPAHLIATEPLAQRDQARLMVIDRHRDDITHRHIHDLPSLLRAGDLLVVNDSRVLPAYISGTRCGTGGRVTGLYLGGNDAQKQWEVMLESRGTLQPGERIQLDETTFLELLQRLDGGTWRVKCHGEGDTLSLLQRLGSPPLPPYIRKARKNMHLPELDERDAQRYNTVYACLAGSVAAPTAGLHFTPELLAQLQDIGVEQAQVTLHVGLGTFAPIRSADLSRHTIHHEWMSVPGETLDKLLRARQRGHRIVAVGTTTVRALESLPAILPDPVRTITMETNLFITPGRDGETPYPFRFTDALLTNFHLPRSSLLALVAALPDVGITRLKRYYRHAIERQYRFYSYGDAMLLC